MKDGVLRIGKPALISFTGKAATDFLALTKEKQVEYVSENTSPTGDVERAKKLLVGVPHGESKPKDAPADKPK